VREALPDFNLGTARGRIVIETGQAVQNLDKVQRAHQQTLTKLRQQSFALQRAGTIFLGTGAALLAGVGLAVRAAQVFQTNLDRVGAFLHTTGDQLNQVKKLAFEFGSTLGFSANEMLDAFASMAKQGVQTQEILDGMGKAAALLARAGELPLLDATTLLVNGLRTFQLPAKQAVSFVNLLAGAARSGTATIADLTQSLKFIGPAASVTKTSAKDVVSALVLMSNHGIRATIAGTALRGMLVRLQGPTAKAHQLLEDLGIITKKETNQFINSKGAVLGYAQTIAVFQKAIANLTPSEKQLATATIFGVKAVRDGKITYDDYTASLIRLQGGTAKSKKALEDLGIITEKGGNLFFTSAGKMKSLSDVAQILQDHTKNLTQAQKQETFYTLFGQRAMSAGIILAEEGAKGFAHVASRLKEVTAQAIASKKLDNLTGAVLRLKAAWQTALIQAGSPFQKILIHIANAATHVLNTFSRLPKSVQTAIVWITLIGGAFLTLIGSFLLIMSVIGRLEAAFITLSLIEEGEGISAGFAAIATGLLTGALIALQTALAFLLSPIGLVIAAIVAVVGALIALYHWVKPVREFFNFLGRGVATGFKAVINFLKTLPREITRAFGAVVRFFERLPGDIRRDFDTVIRFFKRLGPEILSGIKTGFDAVVRFFKSLPRRLAEGALAGLKGLAFLVAASFLLLPKIILFALTKGLPLITRFFVDLVLLILHAMVNAPTLLLRIGNDIIHGLWLGLQAGWNLVILFFTNVPHLLFRFWVNSNRWLVEAGWKLIQGLWNGITIGAVALWQFFTRLPGRILRFIPNAATWLYHTGLDMVKGLLRGIADVGKAIWHGLQDGFNFAMKKLDISKQWNAFLKALSDSWNTVWNGMKQVLGTFVSFTVTMVRHVADAFLGMVSAILGALSHLPFIGKYFASAKTAVDKFHSDIDATLSSIAADASGWGKTLGQNYADGIANKVFATQQAAAKLAGSVARVVRISSPAEEGPLAQDGGTEVWGNRLVKNLAKGMLAAREHVRAAAALVASSVANTITATPVPALSVVGSAAALRGTTHVIVHPPELSPKLAEEIGKAVAAQLDGARVEMDGTLVGNLVTPHVSRSLGRAVRTRTRGSR
jgi:TP901 family phage tail tape measure protein